MKYEQSLQDLLEEIEMCESIVQVSKTVDTAKLKQDGIYENYVKEVSKSDYIKVSLGKEV